MLTGRSEPPPVSKPSKSGHNGVEITKRQAITPCPSLLVAAGVPWNKETYGPLNLIPNTNIPLTTTTVGQYLEEELKVSELDGIYQRLWLAGPPRRYIKPLHHHKVLCRDVVVSERFHLIVRNSTLYVKPIPPCLLHCGFFEQYVLGQRNREDLALGYLSSYLGLITHESDLHIANELHIFPETVEWQHWLTLSKFISDHVNALGRVPVFNNRYDFGELRLGRVNIIVAISTFRARGYARLSTTYSEHLRSFWSIVTVLVFVFLSTAFSAFSVVQGNTEQSPIVSAVGLWLAIGTLCFLAALIVLPSLWFLIIFIDNLRFAYVNLHVGTPSS